MSSPTPKSRWALALEPETSTVAPDSKWSNKDMDPVPVHLRSWTTWNYVAYWISDAVSREPYVWGLHS
jgi:NCS1 family nucleobase:cation symporter-1